MQTATCKAFINNIVNRKGESTVNIRVTFDRKRKYYKTNIFCQPEMFKRAMTAKRRTDDDKKLFTRIRAFEDRAMDTINKLPIFTFDLFEELYQTNRDAASDVFDGFDKKIKELYASNAVGTAVVYECALKNLKTYRPELRFADISVKFLNDYENVMVNEGNTLTTVSMYIRCLRHIWNKAKIAAELSPFGQGKYEIPEGANIKKALSLEDVGRIMNYKVELGGMAEMARDYWIFLYLCNGINVKDMCLLKQKDITGNRITYRRAKTTKTKKKNIAEIQISLKPQTKEVIRKWGKISLDPEAYVFPHLEKGMTAIRQREVYQQVTHVINKWMKRIAKELEIKMPVTTYAARHSFATVLKRSGASTEAIGELLGHGNLKTTQRYLGSFESDMLDSLTDSLLPKAVINH